MPRLILNSCCCGLASLRTGSFIIGYLQLVFQVLFGIALGITLVVAGEIVSGDVGAMGLIYGIIILITAGIYAIFIVLLLVGLHKDNMTFVQSYIIFSTIILVLTVVEIILDMFNPSATLANSLLGAALTLYSILVIRSYRFDMLRKTQVPAYA